MWESSSSYQYYHNHHHHHYHQYCHEQRLKKKCWKTSFWRLITLPKVETWSTSSQRGRWLTGFPISHFCRKKYKKNCRIFTNNQQDCRQWDRGGRQGRKTVLIWFLEKNIFFWFAGNNNLFPFAGDWIFPNTFWFDFWKRIFPIISELLEKNYYRYFLIAEKDKQLIFSPKTNDNFIAPTNHLCFIVYWVW